MRNLPRIVAGLAQLHEVAKLGSNPVRVAISRAFSGAGALIDERRRNRVLRHRRSAVESRSLEIHARIERAIQKLRHQARP
jgi:hypothetical protein